MPADAADWLLGFVGGGAIRRAVQHGVDSAPDVVAKFQTELRQAYAGGIDTATVQRIAGELAGKLLDEFLEQVVTDLPAGPLA